MRLISVLIFSILTLSLSPRTSSAFCFEEAGLYYGIAPEIIKGIATVESSLNPNAIGWNSNGTYDYGLMQINTIWEPVLRKMGIPWEALADPCTNVMAGAWILAGRMQKYGYSWNAIGAYHSATPDKRDRYSKKVASLVLGGGKP